MSEDLEAPYRAATAESGAHVVDENEVTVLACGSAASAEQYAVILNQAYRRGYKTGYRAGKLTGK